MGNGDKKIISELYHIFLSMNLHNSLQIKQRREAETNKVISQDTWKEVCTEAVLVTNLNTWREFKWKIITRFFRNNSQDMPNTSQLMLEELGNTQCQSHPYILDIS